MSLKNLQTRSQENCCGGCATSCKIILWATPKRFLNKDEYIFCRGWLLSETGQGTSHPRPGMWEHRVTEKVEHGKRRITNTLLCRQGTGPALCRKEPAPDTDCSMLKRERHRSCLNISQSTSSHNGKVGVTMGLLPPTCQFPSGRYLITQLSNHLTNERPLRLFPRPVSEDCQLRH
jgi:hypothetical protein